MESGKLTVINGYNPTHIFYGFAGMNYPNDFFWGADTSVLKQVHGNEVVEIARPLSKVPVEADGQITTDSNIRLAIMTADCVPVLFHTNKSDVIGACHAGWKGALVGVTDNVIKKMLDNKVKREEITAIIGPCIRQKSYEVGREFYDRFLASDLDNDCFFIDSNRKEHYMFDLPGYVKARLTAMKIGNIVDCGIDTLSSEGEFHSYRRSTLQGKLKADGSNYSIIGFAREQK